jgi:cell division protein FtsL
MIEIWHNILNVGVVLAAVVVVTIVLSIKNPIRKGLACLAIGIGIYVFEILLGDCTAYLDGGLVNAIKLIDDCLDAYSYPLLLAQVLILSGVFIIPISIFSRKLTKEFSSDFEKIEKALEEENSKQEGQ